MLNARPFGVEELPAEVAVASPRWGATAASCSPSSENHSRTRTRCSQRATRGLRSIGEIALLGVGCAFLGTTVLFPAILALLERPQPGAPGEYLDETLSLPLPVDTDEEDARRSA